MLCISGSVDATCNAGNRPYSKTTSMFRPVRQVVAPVGRRTLFGRNRKVAATGVKSTVSDCILLLQHV